MMMGQETAAVTAQGAAMAAALAPAAWAKLVVEPGAAGIATGLLTAGLSAAAGAGAASNAITSFGSGKESLGNFNFGESGLGERKFAAGGVVTAPTHALIGEKSYPEAVLPLRSSVLQKITSFLFDGVDFGASSGDGANVEIINYGDINTGADYDTFMEDIQYSLAMGVRG